MKGCRLLLFVAVLQAGLLACLRYAMGINMISKSDINIYYCGEEACNPGHFFGPAIRPHYLMHVILNGKGFYEAKGKKFEVNKGEAFLIRPQEITYYEADKGEPWEYSWVAFDGEKTEEMLKKAGFTADNPICNILRLEDCKKYLHQLVSIFDKADSNEYELTGLFYLIFSTAEIVNQKEEEAAEQGYYVKALTFIRHNYGYDIKVSDIARYVGIDRTYLFKIFKHFLGKSVKEYLTEYRLLTAKYMLQHSSYNMTEVALSCGFYDLSSFSRNFKKAEGITPMQYRSMSSKETDQ